MSRLLIATNNPDKVKEIRSILGGFYDEIVSLKEAGISLEVEEDGDTFEQNAVKKAREAAAIAGCDTLADDSGLCVDALDGAPGVYSARYAGEDVTYADNNEKLLREMAGRQDRGAAFVCCVALVRGSEVITSIGQVRGQIAQHARGDGGFGYDPLFYLPEMGKTYAELDEKEKNAMSHRFLALQALRRRLEDSSA